MTDPLSNGGAPVLEVRNLSKRFDMTQALDDVSLRLHAGEIHALVGENGAGKSTLIKILTGVVQSDAGEVFVEGEAVHLHTPRRRRRPGWPPSTRSRCCSRIWTWPRTFSSPTASRDC